MSSYAGMVEELEGLDECKPAVFTEVKQFLSINECSTTEVLANRNRPSV